jgi:NAD(P)-dependent dehydrogenase (short-subunit alcohol dehydrogenase family)
MGREYALGFLEAGSRVVATDMSWEGDGAEELKQRIEDSGRGLIRVMDVTQEEEIAEALDATLGAFGTVDVLLNNAGMRQRNLFPPMGSAKVLDIDMADWRRMFEVNVFGTLQVIRAFIKPMIEKRSGSIINVSTTGTVPAYYRPKSREQPYMGSKAALTNLSIYLAEEVKEHNIAVNTIFPPHVQTTGTKEQDVLRKKANPYFTGATPLRPDSVVPLAKFLADQDASTGVTGETITTIEWNLLHGYGAPEAWMPDDD